MRVVYLAIPLLLLLNGTVARAQSACRAAFLPLVAAVSTSETEGLVSDLASLRLRLDQARNRGLLKSRINALESAYRSTFDAVASQRSHALARGIERGDLTARVRTSVLRLQTLAGGAPLDLSEIQRRGEERAELLAPDPDGREIIFYPIRPGSFVSVPQSVPITLTKPFEIASTLTTQMVWREIVNLAHQFYVSEYYALVADPSNHKGELNPVESVSFNDVQLWLRAANQILQAGHPAALKLFPGYKPGTMLRLPTEAESIFVATNRGAAREKYYFGTSESDLDNHSWHRGNSESTTHPVAGREALVIDGKKFFDIIGNVHEFTATRWSSHIAGGVDPHDPADKDLVEPVVVRGGGAFNVNFHASDLRLRVERDHASLHTGFRIVQSARE